MDWPSSAWPEVERRWGLVRAATGQGKTNDAHRHVRNTVFQWPGIADYVLRYGDEPLECLEICYGDYWIPDDYGFEIEYGDVRRLLECQFWYAVQSAGAEIGPPIYAGWSDAPDCPAGETDSTMLNAVWLLPTARVLLQALDGMGDGGPWAIRFLVFPSPPPDEHSSH